MPANKRYDPSTRTERFLQKVNQGSSDECWEWTAHCIRDGYGRVLWDGKMALAHRVSYTLFVGSIPEDMCVCHHCDNPPCVNPQHLFLGTRKENMQDMAAKGRAGGCPQPGETNPQAVLKEHQVLLIRKMYATKLWTQKAIASQFNVSFQLISLIVNRKIWSHI